MAIVDETRANKLPHTTRSLITIRSRARPIRLWRVGFVLAHATLTTQLRMHPKRETRGHPWNCLAGHDRLVMAEKAGATMIESIHFQNFKVLRDTTLPLKPFTLLVGPNGSGKSTVLQALELAKLDAEHKALPPIGSVLTAGLPSDGSKPALFELRWTGPTRTIRVRIEWKGPRATKTIGPDGPTPTPQVLANLEQSLKATAVYAFGSKGIAAPCALQSGAELKEDGSGLAAVLDQLRDEAPERFEMLNAELGRLIPEFDRILFKTQGIGARLFLLRQRHGQNTIPPNDLSQGTLIALAILTLAYMPNPPSIIGLEEPDRGLHPRLLRDIRDALYRLSYPEKFGETRKPVQVIATTHSPFFLDLFRDHPEEIVIANKVGQEAKFERLSDRRDINEILGDASLGDVWYTGILGGVPCEK